jgi:hypothetical protein
MQVCVIGKGNLNCRKKGNHNLGSSPFINQQCGNTQYNSRYEVKENHILML